MNIQTGRSLESKTGSCQSITPTRLAVTVTCWYVTHYLRLYFCVIDVIFIPFLAPHSIASHTPHTQINLTDKMNGHVVEMQLTLTAYLEIKMSGGHKAYEVTTDPRAYVHTPLSNTHPWSRTHTPLAHLRIFFICFSSSR